MKRITIKVGSSFFIDSNGNVNVKKIASLVEQIAKLMSMGIKVCLVSSGAIAVGLKKMGLKKKPQQTSKKQALAAIGQMSLMQFYEQVFESQNLKCAQILLSHDDFGNRTRINNLKIMTDELFAMNVVPIVNENDAVATAEIKVGDNDTLSAMMSMVIESDLLVLVSDVDGLFTANPNTNPDAKFIETVEKIDNYIIQLATPPSSEFGTGGMITKIRAAEISTRAGIPMAIINQTAIESLSLAPSGKIKGTFFKASLDPLPLKTCWITYLANIVGSIVVDDGAKEAVISRKSLLSCGITEIKGAFEAGENVSIVDKDGIEIARGTCDLPSNVVRSLVGKKKAELVIHANNIGLLN